jgi:dipeptidyl aminopeptidase/acylaminoacyl peptidase
MSLVVADSTMRRRHLTYNTVFMISLLILSALLSYLIWYLNNFPSTEKGTLITAASQSRQDLSHSLDLKTASRLKYPSGDITVVKDLGTSDNVQTKIISFNVPIDGLSEYGLMTLPSGSKPDKGYPAIILCHGYTSPNLYSTTEFYREDMVFYSQHGFAVIKPDYRGQGLSSHQGVADSAYYSMSYNTDVMSLISAVKNTKYVDPGNINLWGHSMGAYIALRASVLSPDIKNTILLAGPVDSLSKMYYTYTPPSDVNNLYALRTRNNVFSKYGIPSENSSFWQNASPINLLMRTKAHIQIHEPSQDQVVPPEFSADLDAALTKDGIKHDFFVYEEGVHSLQAQRPLIWQRSLDALSRSAAKPAKTT